MAVWFAASFGWEQGGFGELSSGALSGSLLAGVGRYLAPLFAPLGWGDWRLVVAACSGLLAKESIVSTLGVLCPGGLAGLSLTVPAALSFLLFNLLCAPCLAALAALRQEMASPAFLVRGGLSDRVGLADRLWGLSGGNAAPPAITPSQGEGRVCHGKRKNSTSAHDKGGAGAVYRKDKVSFRAWHRDRRAGVSDAIVSKSSDRPAISRASAWSPRSMAPIHRAALFRLWTSMT